MTAVAAGPHEGAAPAVREALACETLVEGFRRAATRNGQIAFRIESLDADPVESTWSELDEAVRAAARGFRRLGISPGDRVLLVLPTSPEFVILFWGLLHAGATPVPAYPPAGWRQLVSFSQTLARLVGVSAARMVVVPEPLRDVLRNEGAEPAGAVVILPGEILEAGKGGSDPEIATGPEDFALIQFSSGSTGEPRGIALSHRNVVANIRGFADRMALRSDDVLTSWLPMYHDMGLIGTMVAPLLIGMPVVLISPLDFLRKPALWLRTLAKYRATISVAPQFAYNLCNRKVRAEDLDGDLSSVRILLNGAEPIEPTVLDEFEARFAPAGLAPHVVTPCYGLGESTLAVTMGHAGRPRRRTRPRDGDTVSPVVSVGPPLRETEVRVLSDDGALLGDGVIGEIQVRSPSVCRGVLSGEGLLSAVTDDGWLPTGDMGFVDGGEFFVTGRSKDVIIVGGKNHFPQEIENEAARVPGVRRGRVVAFGVPEPVRGTEVLVVVAECDDSPPVPPERIAADLRQAVLRGAGIAPHDVWIVARGQLPLTTSGKLRRSEARRLYREAAFEDVLQRG